MLGMTTRIPITAELMHGPFDGRDVRMTALVPDIGIPAVEALEAHSGQPIEPHDVMTQRKATYRHDPLRCDPFEAEFLDRHRYWFVGIRS